MRNPAVHCAADQLQHAPERIRAGMRVVFANADGERPVPIDAAIVDPQRLHRAANGWQLIELETDT